MEQIGVRELRQNASRYLARVANGEAIEVTDRGRPVARLVPVPGPGDALADLIASGRLRTPDDDSELEDASDFKVDASGRLARMRADER
ncbi:MAG TPA: type II toxin-antitoxin system prevent-host-death family antitoxin [Acidimicrobiia bacterium]|nr:type II toxin-antitoxin system prevent-host-death family antitoxin [Acidimicrobiia bacterium]